MSPDRPDLHDHAWYQPGMPADEVAVWEAAERAVAAAPEIHPGDEIALRLQHLYRDLPQFLRDYHTEQHRRSA